MKYLFLDFDETLFNHYTYLNWVDDFLVRRHQIVPGAFSDTIDDYHISMGEKLRLYQHAQHIEGLTRRKWEFLSGELEKELQLLDYDFCYPEVHQTVEQIIKLPLDIRILTYGDGAYQRFKLNTCSLLHHLRLPVHVIDEPKRLFLGREFGATQGMLVDDKHPLNLPSNWTHIWINRQNDHQEKLGRNMRRIDDLTEVEDYALALTKS